MKLSIIIPVFNEKNTIEKIINKINNLKNLDKEIIVVDDFSNDRTTFILKKSIYKKVNKIIYHKKNLGKGAAIKSAKKFISGDIIIIQDADLEYDPKDYYKLIMKTQNVNLKINYVKKNLNGTPRKILDCSLARRFGWKSSYSLEEGLKITISDFIKNFNNYEK